MTATSWHFQSDCEEDLDKVLNRIVDLFLSKTIRLFALDFYAQQLTQAALLSTIAPQKFASS